MKPTSVLLKGKQDIKGSFTLRMSWGVLLWLLYMQEDNDIWQYVVALQRQSALRLWNNNVICQLWQKIAHTPKDILKPWNCKGFLYGSQVWNNERLINVSHVLFSHSTHTGISTFVCVWHERYSSRLQLGKVTLNAVYYTTHQCLAQITNICGWVTIALWMLAVI